MGKDRLPYMPFYVSDYLSSMKVRCMKAAERGIYTHLLFVMWQEGKLPDDERFLRRAADCEPEEFAAAWPKVREHFEVDGDGNLYNDKLEKERSKQISSHRKRVDAGSKGGSKAQANRVAKEEQSSSNASSNATSPASSNGVATKPNQTRTISKPKPNQTNKANGKGSSPPALPDYPADFDRFWAAYPRKVGKRAALKAWESLNPDRALVSRMVTAITEQVEHLHFLGNDGEEFVPHPSTWINRGQWDDEVEKPPEEPPPPEPDGFGQDWKARAKAKGYGVE